MTTILENGFEGHALPAVGVWLYWMRTNTDYQVQFARAKEEQAEFMEQELIDIADEGRNDYMASKYGPQVNAEHIARSRLRIDTRRWLMGKLRPKKYGDKVQLTGDGGGPVKTQSTVLDPVKLAAMTPEELKAAIALSEKLGAKDLPEYE